MKFSRQDLARRRRVALKHPCQKPEEASDQRFEERHTIKGKYFASFLTVDRSCRDERFTRPSWHVSISLFVAQRVLPTKHWRNADCEQAMALATAIIKSGGTGDIFVDGGPYALHVYRQVSLDEMAKIPAEFFSDQEPS